MMEIWKYEKIDYRFDSLDELFMRKKERKESRTTKRIHKEFKKVRDLYGMQAFLAKNIDIPSFYEDIEMCPLKSFSECPLTDEETNEMGLDLLTWDKTHFLTLGDNYIYMTEIEEWRKERKEEDERW